MNKITKSNISLVKVGMNLVVASGYRETTPVRLITVEKVTKATVQVMVSLSTSEWYRVTDTSNEVSGKTFNRELKYTNLYLADDSEMEDIKNTIEKNLEQAKAERNAKYDAENKARAEREAEKAKVVNGFWDYKGEAIWKERKELTPSSFAITGPGTRWNTSLHVEAVIRISLETSLFSKEESMVVTISGIYSETGQDGVSRSGSFSHSLRGSISEGETKEEAFKQLNKEAVFHALNL